MHGAPSWREPAGRRLSVAASYLHAGNHVRKLGSTVRIRGAQECLISIAPAVQRRIRSPHRGARQAPASHRLLASKRDRFKQLRAFCEAARLGSISGAAKALHLSQPAVSLQVRSLEEEFGVALFERNGPRITLTRVGERLYECAMPLVQGVLRLPALFAEAHHGMSLRRLRIGAGQASAAYLLPGPLKRFRRAPPLDTHQGAHRQPARSGSSGCVPSSSTPSSASSMRPRPASSSTRCARPEWCS